MNKENIPSAKKQTHFKQFPQKINSLPQFKKSASTKNIPPPPSIQEITPLLTIQHHSNLTFDMLLINTLIQ